jgi:hypothetical protein
MHPSGSAPSPSDVAASKAGNEDAKDRDDAVNDDLDASCDCVDDAHDACSNGAEEVSDLWSCQKARV